MSSRRSLFPIRFYPKLGEKSLDIELNLDSSERDNQFSEGEIEKKHISSTKLTHRLSL